MLKLLINLIILPITLFIKIIEYLLLYLIKRKD